MLSLTDYSCCPVLVLIVALLFSAGCSDSDDPIFGITPSYPILHEYPDWSPDGRYITYRDNGIVELSESGSFAVDSDSIGIWIIGSNGLGKKILIHNADFGKWSNNSNLFVYILDGYLFTAAINNGTLDSLSVSQLTNTGVSIYPAWSHDDEWIYFEYRLNHGDNYSIWRIRNDGTGMEKVVDARCPTCSCIGDSLGGIVNTDSGYEVAVFNMNGILLNQLTDSKGIIERYPAYSPRGGYISCLGVSSTSSFIRILSTAGNVVNDLMIDVCDTGLEWNNDGSMIVFSKRNTIEYNTNGTIWIVGINGENLRQMTESRIQN